MVETNDRQILDLNFVKQAKKVRTLFDRLTEHLWELDPQVAIKPRLVDEIEEWLNGIRDEHELALYYGSFGIIHGGIDWNRPFSAAGSTCGAFLLQHLGHMGEATVQYGGGTTPPDPLTFIIACINDPNCPELVEISRDRTGFIGLNVSHDTLGLTGTIVSPGPECEFEFEQIPQQTYDNLLSHRRFSY